MPPRSRAAWDVLGVGGNSLDLVYRLPALPQMDGAGSKLRIAEHTRFPGGQVATTLATVAASGLRAKYIGAFGDDDNGRLIRAELSSRSIDIGSAITRPVPNPYAVILIDNATGERVVLWHRDEGLTLGPADVRPEHVAAARLVHVDDVDQEAAIRTAALAAAAGVPVTSDIDRVTDRTPALIDAVSVAICAEHVPAQLTGQVDPEHALRALRRHHGGTLVVTLGARGAMMLQGDRLFHEPAVDIMPVDTTGAGDVFRGGFIIATLLGWGPSPTLRLANRLAALKCLRRGAMAGVPGHDDIARAVADVAQTVPAPNPEDANAKIVPFPPRSVR
jgi:sugar/nucleoside kinase (ribokinase family)